jgi:hypothetical protein
VVSSPRTDTTPFSFAHTEASVFFVELFSKRMMRYNSEKDKLISSRLRRTALYPENTNLQYLS